jgi:hypothetical protein
MGTSSSRSRQPLPRAVAAETAKTSGPVCVFSRPESPVSFPTQPAQMHVPARAVDLWGVVSRAMLSISVVIAATRFPEPGLPTRSFDGRTDFVARFLPPPPAGFVWKSCLFCDLEDFDFLHLETSRTRENRLLVQSDVVGVSVTTGSPTAGVCVAVMENTNVPSSQWR